MFQEISNNKKNIAVLEKLISSGYYEGTIEDSCFELTRTVFPINHKITGILNDNNFKITSTYTYSIMNIAFKIVVLIVSIIIIYYLLNKNFFIALFLSLILSLFLILEYFNRRKEIRLFMDKFFHMYKLYN